MDHCATCHYWDTDYYWNRWTYDSRGNEVLVKEGKPIFRGLCRRHAPAMEEKMMNKGFPVTQSTDWCGEWEPK